MQESYFIQHASHQHCLMKDGTSLSLELSVQ